jgi:hypothetical protein
MALPSQFPGIASVRPSTLDPLREAVPKGSVSEKSERHWKDEQDHERPPERRAMNPSPGERIPRFHAKSLCTFPEATAPGIPPRSFRTIQASHGGPFRVLVIDVQMDPGQHQACTLQDPTGSGICARFPRPRLKRAITVTCSESHTIRRPRFAMDRTLRRFSRR